MIRTREDGAVGIEIEFAVNRGEFYFRPTAEEELRWKGPYATQKLCENAAERYVLYFAAKYLEDYLVEDEETVH